MKVKRKPHNLSCASLNSLPELPELSKTAWLQGLLLLKIWQPGDCAFAAGQGSTSPAALEAWAPVCQGCHRPPVPTGDLRNWELTKQTCKTWRKKESSQFQQKSTCLICVCISHSISVFSQKTTNPAQLHLLRKNSSNKKILTTTTLSIMYSVVILWQSFYTTLRIQC